MSDGLAFLAGLGQGFLTGRQQVHDRQRQKEEDERRRRQDEREQARHDAQMRRIQREEEEFQRQDDIRRRKAEAATPRQAQAGQIVGAPGQQLFARAPADVAFLTDMERSIAELEDKPQAQPEFTPRPLQIPGVEQPAFTPRPQEPLLPPLMQEVVQPRQLGPRRGYGVVGAGVAPQIRAEAPAAAELAAYADPRRVVERQVDVLMQAGDPQQAITLRHQFDQAERVRLGLTREQADYARRETGRRVASYLLGAGDQWAGAAARKMTQTDAFGLRGETVTHRVSPDGKTVTYMAQRPGEQPREVFTVPNDQRGAARIAKAAAGADLEDVVGFLVQEAQIERRAQERAEDIAHRDAQDAESRRRWEAGHRIDQARLGLAQQQAARAGAGGEARTGEITPVQRARLGILQDEVQAAARALDNPMLTKEQRAAAEQRHTAAVSARESFLRQLEGGGGPPAAATPPVGQALLPGMPTVEQVRAAGAPRQQPPAVDPAQAAVAQRDRDARAAEPVQRIKAQLADAGQRLEAAQTRAAELQATYLQLAAQEPPADPAAKRRHAAAVQRSRAEAREALGRVRALEVTALRLQSQRDERLAQLTPEQRALAAEPWLSPPQRRLADAKAALQTERGRVTELRAAYQRVAAQPAPSPTLDPAGHRRHLAAVDRARTGVRQAEWRIAGLEATVRQLEALAAAPR